MSSTTPGNTHDDYYSQLERLADLPYMDKQRQEMIFRALIFQDTDGYPNLRWWKSSVGDMIAEGDIAGRAVIRINLKHFSMVNDQVGRNAGDVIIREFFRILGEKCGEEGFIARINGDNFIALCDKHHLQGVVECLQSCPVSFGDAGSQRIELSCAAGIYVIPEGSKDTMVMSLIDKATAAYNIAKRNTLAETVFYSEDMRREIERAALIQSRFNNALANDEITVYYQPAVDIIDRELIAAEALCRWDTGDRLLLPDDFLPILEQSTDICRLDFRVLDIVCRDIRGWLDRGLGVKRVSVMFSRRHLMNPDLFESIISTIDRNNVPHEYIQIVFTEINSDVEYHNTKKLVHELQATGINAALDNFGSGHSSLDILRDIPWNTIKLDDTVTPSPGDNEEIDIRVFAHVTSMIQDIGRKCVAKGVETAEQLAIVQQYGCRVVQGYIFDEPLPAAEFEKRLTGNPYNRHIEDLDKAWNVRIVENKIRSMTPGSIAQALSSDSMTIYCVDTDTDAFVEYTASDLFADAGIEKSGSDFFGLCYKNAETTLHPDDLEMFRSTFTKENILAHTKQNETFIFNYRMLLRGEPVWLQLKATALSPLEREFVVIGITNIDSQMKHREELERIREEHLTYSRISALAGDYLCIYSVDPETGRYTTYSRDARFESLGLSYSGEDFFDAAMQDALRVIYIDDADMFMRLFTKERVLHEIAENGMFTVTYRLRLGDTPTYVRLKATIIEEEGIRQLIVGVNNVNAQVRREQEFARRLSDARSRASVDALTGVRNKHAYVDAEELLNRSIEEKTPLDFAVVVFDVNDLKLVNDTKGHLAGDEYLKEACSTICDIFKRSPVYRVGGDEFAVIARGSDYENIDRLIEDVGRSNAENARAGRAVVACGMARYAGDRSVGAVFERADREMYKNKNSLKLNSRLDAAMED